MTYKTRCILPAICKILCLVMPGAEWPKLPLNVRVRLHQLHQHGNAKIFRVRRSPEQPKILNSAMLIG